jgi:hypothetical protein
LGFRKSTPLPAQTRQGNIKPLIPSVGQQDFARLEFRAMDQSLALAVISAPLSRISGGRLYIELSSLSAPKGEER